MIDKENLFRILQCVILIHSGMKDLEINKQFNFKEMDTAKEVLKVIEKGGDNGQSNK